MIHAYLSNQQSIATTVAMRDSLWYVSVSSFLLHWKCLHCVRNPICASLLNHETATESVLSCRIENIKGGFSITSRRVVATSFYHYHHSCYCGYHTSSTTTTHLTSSTSRFLIIPDSGFKEPCLTITKHCKLNVVHAESCVYTFC